MRFPWLILLYLFFPFIALAQNGVITGVVTTTEKKPLPRASVFLSNSSVGTATNESGAFTLSGIRPGQYTLVVTILGYEDYSKSILVSHEPIKIDIEMTQKPLMLREVVISSSADWKRNYESFKRQFIGTDGNAKYCDVINPHILNLTFNQTKQILHADADEFLVVENKALGYRVKYLLRDFTSDGISGITSYGGGRLFEDLPGSEAQKKKWHEKREEAYYGSPMHFYRSLYADKLTEAGFKISRLRRYVNPERPADEVISHKIKTFSQLRMADSANYWINKANMSRYYNESIDKVPLMQYEIFSRDTQQGLFDLHFINYLYVVYTKKTDDVYNKDIYRPMDMPNYAVSVVTLSEPYVVFDLNGIVVNGSPLYEGVWATQRLSDLLPVDYVPDNK